jgi:hypothetical protein
MNNFSVGWQPDFRTPDRGVALSQPKQPARKSNRLGSFLAASGGLRVGGCLNVAVVDLRDCLNYIVQQEFLL